MSRARRLLRAFHQLDREDRVEILREHNLVPEDGHVPSGDGREFRVWCATALNRAERGYRPDGDGYSRCGSLSAVRDSVRRRLRRSFDEDALEVGIIDAR